MRIPPHALLFFLLMHFLPLSVNGQSYRKLDSLVKAAAKLPEDTTKVKACLSVFREAYSLNADTALHYGRSGLELSKRIGDKRGTAAFLSHLANLYVELGDYVRGLDYNLQAIGLYEELGDRKNKARCLMNCGNVFYYQQDIDRAISYHAQGLAIYDSIGNRKGAADCLMNLGNDYIASKDTVAALDCYRRSLAIREAIGDKIGVAQTCNNLAETYSEMRDYAKAGADFRRALEIKRELGDMYSMAPTLLGMGKMEYARANYSQAIAYAGEALDAAAVSRHNRIRANAYKVLAECYSAQGDYRKAYVYHTMYSALNDSLFSEEGNRNISEMRTIYETDKKEKENEALLHQNKVQALESAKKDAEISSQRWIILSAVVGLVLVAILALLIFKGYRDKRKANLVISQQKAEVERQRDLVEEKQKEVLDSIHYAKRIQRALLASENVLEKHLPAFFVLYCPKDIVSGDFYWASALPDGRFLLLAGDCTGHGVPGAFMSLLNITLLNEIVVEHRITQPDDVLNEVRRDIVRVLNPEGSAESAKDGMDCSLVRFDFAAMEMDFACAYNPLWLCRDGIITEYKADKQPVGAFEGEERPFTRQAVKLRKGDLVYLLTDGFADQFGGPKGKKFKLRRFQEKLAAISTLPVQEQKKELERTFDEWKGTLEQIDDVLVIGVKI